ncbi:hypothetical protein [Neorhodopirellula pilleata]|nr:hypothetical protein [Neorhodopirellula pilleata]
MFDHIDRHSTSTASSTTFTAGRFDGGDAYFHGNTVVVTDADATVN